MEPKPTKSLPKNDHTKPHQTKSQDIFSKSQDELSFYDIV